jgi:hypothetical protein
LLLVQTPQGLCLPLDLLGIVAKWLVTMEMHETCAALNVTSSGVRYETTPVLWRRVQYRWKNGKNSKKKSAAQWKAIFEAEAVKYIE